MNIRPKIPPFFVFIIITFILITTQIASIPQARSSPTTELSFTPLLVTVKPQTRFTISVLLTDSPQFVSFDITVTYNTSIIDALNANITIPWTEGAIDIDHTAGTVYFSAMNLTNPLQGSQTLAAIEFQSTANGNSSLQFVNTQILNPQLDQIPHNTQEGTVEVITSMSLTLTAVPRFYYPEQNVTICGNATVEGTPVDALIGIQVRRLNHEPVIMRTVTSGYVSSNASWLPTRIVDFYSSDEYGNHTGVFMAGYPAYFTIYVQNLSNKTLPILIAINVFDKYNGPIGVARASGFISPYTTMMYIGGVILSFATFNGTATAYATVFSDYPENKGVPYCPEQSITFQIDEGVIGTPPAVPPTNPSFTSNYNLTYRHTNKSGLAEMRLYATALYKIQNATAYNTFAVANMFVDDNGPTEFHTIQSAINNATDGKAIGVYAGIYNENIVVNKTIALVGENNNATIINGRALDTIVKMTNDYAIVMNFNMMNSSTASGHNFGISILNHSCRVINNIISDTTTGIALFGFNDTDLLENTISENTYGILANGSSHTLIENNLITNNNYGITFSTPQNTYSTIYNNTVTNNTVVGLQFVSTSYSDITANKLSYNDHGFEISGLTSQHNTFNDGTVSFNGVGVLLESCANITINRLTAFNNTVGVQLVNTSQSTIYGSQLSYNNYGLEILGSSSNRNVLNFSQISFNGVGISLESCANNTINENNVTSNTQYGIWISNSDDNEIYDNNFINNQNQTYCNALKNKFDIGYPKGGNYWSDYTGTDTYHGPYQNLTGGDGIGDTPYQIQAPNNTDHYPYMMPSYESDIGVTNITLGKTVVGFGYAMSLNVTVTNYGHITQMFILTAYYNYTYLNSTTVGLEARSTSTVTLWWKTTYVPPETYTISASLPSIQGEKNLANNDRTDGNVIVTRYAGDFNGDNKVTPYDLALLIAAYGSTPYPSSPRRWNPNCDINNDNKVGSFDLAVVLANYGKHYP